MLEAHIVSPRGSLYYAGETHPYDLEMLWDHIQEAGYGLAPGDVRLEITVDDEGVDSDVTTWIQRIAANGVRVHLLFSRLAV